MNLDINTIQKVDPNEFARILMSICLVHRQRLGIEGEPRINDCDRYECAPTCPVKNVL
jgi:hypothetical protein